MVFSKILVLNCGSSSLKYALFEKDKLIDRGCVERVGGKLTHEKVIKDILSNFINRGIIKGMDEIGCVGHRVVLGGRSGVIDNKILKGIKKNFSLAPLHNPFNYKGIMIAKKLINAKHVAVFDTDFYSGLCDMVYTYGLPYKLGYRKYGFHGTSHKYINQEVKKRFGSVKLVSCHLGNGCSITASVDGEAVDTSMGFTPMEGVMMGTRAGDIDAGVVLSLVKKFGVNKTESILNKKSGLLGVSGISNDMRDLLKSKSERAKLAIDMFVYRIVKYIGAYSAVLGGVDVIAFTAGIGENAFGIRKEICRRLGILLDDSKNRKNEFIISKKNSKVKVVVIKTDEERMIRDECVRLGFLS